MDDAFVTATHDIHYTDVISISSTATPSAISADTSDGNSTHLPQTHHLSKYGFPFTIEQWGRDEQVHQFFVSTHGELRSWAGSLATAISVTRRRQHIFDAVDFVPERLYADDAGLPFRWSDVHCSLFFEDRLVVGTEGGVFCGRIGDEFARFELIVPRNRVVAVEVVPELNIVFVLAGKGSGK